MIQLMRNYATILAAVFAIFILIAYFNPTANTSLLHLTQRASSASRAGKDGHNEATFNGTWDSRRDSRNFHLSADQCDLAFPGLFDELDKQVAITKQKGIVTRKYMMNINVSDGPDIGGFIEGYIYDQQLYIMHLKKGYFTRAFACVSSIHRALVTSPEPLPNVHFTFYSTDESHDHITWGLTRQASDDKVWLMPDFGYWSWPEPKVSSYGTVQRRARQMEEGPPPGSPPGAGAAEPVYTWANKIPKAVWRGAKGFGPTRDALVRLAADRPWADIKNIQWDPALGHADVLSMADHCKYKYTLQTEGNSYSGRLKYLQNCRSVLVSHKLEWRTHDMHLMRADGPEQNFVEVARDWSDLDAKMEWLLADDARAERIADHMARTFRDRYLSPAAEACYWRRLIRSWSEVSEPPIPWEGKEGIMDWKGVPVEDFLLMHTTDWEQH